MKILANLSTAIAKRRLYNRTVAEIKTMPMEIAWDLNIYKGDAKRIASKAIYGY